MWAVVGLGNPGRRYSETRHNAGFMFIKMMSRVWKVRLKRKTYAKAGEVKRDKDRICLVMPQTYMNNSGFAVRQIIEGRGIAPDRLVVVYDDLDIPLGEIRVRKEGGPGTHQGMMSIIQELSTTRFPRIRVGIGPLPSDEEATCFVLSPFEKTEKGLLGKSLEKAREALEMVLAGDIEGAMNTFNQKRKTA